MGFVHLTLKKEKMRMNWFRKFMIGRYGVDQLNMALLILSVLVTLTASFIRQPIVSYIGYIPVVICVMRMLSRNVQRRHMENYKFIMLINPIYSWYKKVQNKAKDSKTYVHFKCPSCWQGLKVPRGKGRITITCPKCRKQFKERT